MVQIQQNSPSPFNVTMDFALLLANIWDDLTGSRSVIEERGKIRGPDGTEYPNLVQITERDENATSICNEIGAKRVLHQLRLVMNQNNSFADLTRDEIPDIAANACRQAFTVMFANPVEYGVTDLNKLESEGLSLFDTIYVFLTSLKDAGVRKLAIETHQIKMESKENSTDKKGLMV